MSEKYLDPPEPVWWAELAELRAENERLQAYATRLLFEDSRLWHCKECGSEFSSVLNGQPEIPNAETQCPICEEGVAVPKAWIMQDEIARLRKALGGLLHIIEEHGNPVQKAHATKLLEAREALEVKG